MNDLNGELLYNLAAGLGFIAYLLTNVLWLRIILVVGAIVYIITGLVLGLSSMIGWHIGYALINLGHIIILITDARGTALAEPLRTLYAERFSAISAREFKRLLQINKANQIESSTILEQGQENDRLCLILSGQAAVSLNGKTVAKLKAGEFFGEMSVLTGSLASTSVVATDEITYVYWTKSDLQKLERKNLSLYNRFMTSVGLNVIDKLRTTTLENSRLTA